MKDKVSELRKILNQKKSMESKKKSAKFEDPTPEKDMFQTEQSKKKKETIQSKKSELPEGADLQTEFDELKTHYDEMVEANKMQKDMYMRKVAEFENFKKRLQKEQDQMVKYINEKFLEDLLPVLDSFEMTLSHVKEDDPIGSGVKLILKQFLQALEKHGVKQISGEGETFDPHLQEAIATEENEEYEPGIVIQVQRNGYTLHGKVVRAALVTVSK